MYMAVLMPFSLNEKNLSVLWHGRCLKVSLFCFLLGLVFFFQRIISRHLGAAMCTSVVRILLCYTRVRKSWGQHCIAHFKRGFHCQVCTHCLNILETGFVDKVDMETSHPVIYA